MIYVLLLLIISKAIYIEQLSFDKNIYKPGDVAILYINGVIFYSSITDPPKNFQQAIIETSTSFYQSISNIGNLELQNNIPQRFSRTVIIPIPNNNITEGVYTVDVKLSGYLETQRENKIISSYSSIALKVEKERQLDVNIRDRLLFDNGDTILEICTNRPIETVRIKGQFLVKDYYIDYIEGCKNVSISYMISNKTGSIDFPIEIQYNTKFSTFKYNTILKVNVEQTPTNIKLEQVTNLQDGLGKLVLMVNYEGIEEIRDVKIYSKGPILMIKPNYLTIPSLSNNKLRLEVDTFYKGNPGVVLNEFLITYNYKGTMRSITVMLPIKVFSQTNIDVYIEYNNLTAGTPGVLNVVVGNAENYNLLGVKVSLFSNTAQISNSRKFIGEILPNDYTTERFTIIPTAGKNDIKIIVNYRDNVGNEYQREYEYEINASNPIQTKNDNTFIFVIAAIAILLGWFLFRKWKK